MGHCAILIVFSLGLYVRTLAPGLLYGDSTEFQTLVYDPGLTHLVGYSIYLVIGWLFAHFPLGNPAYNMNVFRLFALH
jgi:hypothetical protein